MKFPTLFTKIPKYKRFGYTPRHYDPQEEERKAREKRIQMDMQNADQELEPGYRTRIQGSFRASRKSSPKSFDPSTNIIRLIILTFLTVLIIAYLQYGSTALYALVLFVPFYVWLKFIRK